ncbi:MAG: hypothetical protein O2894_13210, partial [Planctomycetota bacterium]|nr:hypothetical protein [Planctomycetota bacterium]
MSSSPRGVLTRLLPWAALALMVVFFFIQVAERNEARSDAVRARDDLRAFEMQWIGGRALAPPAVA